MICRLTVQLGFELRRPTHVAEADRPYWRSIAAPLCICGGVILRKVGAPDSTGAFVRIAGGFAGPSPRMSVFGGTLSSVYAVPLALAVGVAYDRE